MSNRKFNVGASVMLNVSHPKFNEKKLKVVRIKYSDLYGQNIIVCSNDDDDVYFAIEKELMLID